MAAAEAGFGRGSDRFIDCRSYSHMFYVYSYSSFTTQATMEISKRLN
jgi:hypothetical protein